jgi:hypothetical protein
MKKHDALLSQVEDFIKRIHNGDLIITPEAQKITLTIVVGKDSLGRPNKEQHSLADLLGSAMFMYQSLKSIAIPRSMLKSNPMIQLTVNSRREDVALDLQKYIELAYTHSVIKETGLAGKFEKLQQENEQLKEQNSNLKNLNTELAQQNDKLIKENKRLHAFAPPDARKGKSEFGGLEKP